MWDVNQTRISIARIIDGIYPGAYDPSIPPAANAEYIPQAGHYQCLSD